MLLKASHIPIPRLHSGTISPEPLKSFRVIGHRGSGMNSPSNPRMTSIKENTILSFNHTGRFPVEYVEFDVQVTSDRCPIIFHDVHILTQESHGLSERRVTDLRLDEFLSYGPQRGDARKGKQLLRRNKDGEVTEWAVDSDDPLCTLEDAFSMVDPRLGFNIELKFDDDFDYRESEIDSVLQVVYRVVLGNARDRAVMFSTFHPDAARLMRRIQSAYPVLFLTEAGTEMYVDSRRNSLEAAIKLCSESGLQGIVSEVRGVLGDPTAIARIKGAGLVLLTYGEMNNVPEVVFTQRVMGIDGVIVDLVQEITEAVSELMRTSPFLIS